MILHTLKDLGIKQVRVEFSGGGDSGAIDEVLYYQDNDKIDSCVEPLIHVDPEDFFYRLIDDQTMYTVDWVNNDGGWGSMTIDVESKTFEVDCNFRTSEYHSWDPVEV